MGDGFLCRFFSAVAFRHVNYGPAPFQHPVDIFFLSFCLKTILTPGNILGRFWKITEVGSPHFW
jgi:hypothetical protein